MTSFSTLSLYALTVKAPSATQAVVQGDFTGDVSRGEHILTANGSRLTLYEVSKNSNGFKELFSQDVFGIIRRIGKFRLAGSTKGTSSTPRRAKPCSDFVRHADSYDPRAHVEHGHGMVE